MKITTALFALLATVASSADAFSVPSKHFGMRGGRCVEISFLFLIEPLQSSTFAVLKTNTALDVSCHHNDFLIIYHHVFAL